MPTLPKTPCRHPGCRELVSPKDGWCPAHKRVEQQRIDSNRGSSTERGYNVRWQKARATWLKRHPLCVHCEKAGKVTPATVVDHRIPHKGDSNLFWDTSNWDSCCKPCHDRKTAGEAGTFGRKT